ncbi:MAG: hypothetical protein ACXACI_00160 [Candidatus Hodarchaeales archaeon]|jgi:organic radical activating enzyme
MLSATIAEIFLSLQGEGTPLILLKPQIFFRFASCNLANSEFGTKGCVWCDTPLGKKITDSCRVERTPGSDQFARISNPLSLETAQEEIERLHRAEITLNTFFSPKKLSKTLKNLQYELQDQIPRDSLTRLAKLVRSRLTTLEQVGISFTGGEPLHQFAFARKLAQRLANADYILHLETNATIPDFAEDCASIFNTCSADVKDRTARASKNWKLLAETELKFIERFVEAGNPNIFAKVVITNKTLTDDIWWIAERIEPLEVDLVIQPLTPIGTAIQAPSLHRLEELEQKLLPLMGDQLWFNIQMHKLSLALR